MGLVVDKLSLGVVVMGRAGNIRYRNHRAKAMAGTHTGLLIDDAVDAALRQRSTVKFHARPSSSGPPQVAVVAAERLPEAASSPRSRTSRHPPHRRRAHRLRRQHQSRAEDTRWRSGRARRGAGRRGGRPSRSSIASPSGWSADPPRGPTRARPAASSRSAASATSTNASVKGKETFPPSNPPSVGLRASGGAGRPPTESPRLRRLALGL